MTASGANWLRKALDPFHDFQVRVDGLPDDNTANTIVQEVSLTQTISAPLPVTGICTSSIYRTFLTHLGRQLVLLRRGTCFRGTELLSSSITFPRMDSS